MSIRLHALHTWSRYYWVLIIYQIPYLTAYMNEHVSIKVYTISIGDDENFT